LEKNWEKGRAKGSYSGAMWEIKVTSEGEYERRKGTRRKEKRG